MGPGAIGRHWTLVVMSVITGFWRIGKSGSGRSGDGGDEQEERVMSGG